jgi:hypothetical protein
MLHIGKYRGIATTENWYIFMTVINSGSLFAFTGSVVRKQWLKTPHSWLNLSAILMLISNVLVIKY